MFKSIRVKFITIYFLLVFIAMIIAGIFIVTVFENKQIEQVSESMKNQAQHIIDISPTVRNGEWDKLSKDDGDSSTKDSLLNKLPIKDRVYIIDTTEVPAKIAATNVGQGTSIIGQSVYNNKEIFPSLILKSLKGEEVLIDNSTKTVKHLAYPISGEMEDVKGIIYIASDLDDINETINESKRILVEATLLALFVTVILGFLIANSITEPIKDVTVKAEKMAKGDFKQYVEVKSNDEIGQLANMFNFLTKKLDKTISEIFREKSKMETIFNYMADGVIAVDINGKILHANPIAKNILNINIEDIETREYDEIIGPISSSIKLENLHDENNFKGKKITEIDSSTYMIKYAPFRKDGNEIGGIIIVFQDITEQQKLDEMRKEFVANVSHELKTPITTIKSYTETLLEGALENEEISRQFLGVVNDECDRMSRIVRDLLQLSNFDNQEISWDKEHISLKKLINKSYTKIKMSAEEKNQTIDIYIQKDLPKVFVDKDAIEQVVLNILSNSIKYTQEGGNIQIKATKKEDNVNMTVKDNGIGIPKKEIGRIFERFYRVDKARSRDLGGTGLGLSIAKKIVESHGGNILIESEYNKGTQVSIILPINDK